MLNYTFVQSVKVLNGCDCIDKLGEAIKDLGYSKAFIVCGNHAKKSGEFARATSSLTAAGVEYVEYNEVLPDPPSELVDKGVQLCKAQGCDCVIGFGGGSAIDTAKGINVLRFNEGSILDYATKPMKLCKGLIAVPTTSGTGSELSNGAIVSDSENDIKMPIMCAMNMPELAVLDPKLTVSMPRHLTLLTGLDTFSHCYEAYTGVLSNPMTDLICEKMLETVVKYLPIALNEPDNLIAREKMQHAAAIGGWMLYNACAHVGHSVAHVLGAKLHITHGAACAYGTPSVLKAIAGAVPDKVKMIGNILGAGFDGSETTEEIGEISAAAYSAFTDGLGLDEVDKFELSDAELDALAQAVANEPFAGLCPVKVDTELARGLVRAALGL